MSDIQNCHKIVDRCRVITRLNGRCAHQSDDHAETQDVFLTDRFNGPKWIGPHRNARVAAIKGPVQEIDKQSDKNEPRLPVSRWDQNKMPDDDARS